MKCEIKNTSDKRYKYVSLRPKDLEDYYKLDKLSWFIDWIILNTLYALLVTLL
jgi:hypothetical protein